MSDEIYDSFDADNYALYSFGVVEKGRFNITGGLNDWKLDGSILDESLPRWLEQEPIIRISNGEVYLRGLHSKQLSKERRAAISNARR